MEIANVVCLGRGWPTLVLKQVNRCCGIKRMWMMQGRIARLVLSRQRTEQDTAAGAREDDQDVNPSDTALFITSGVDRPAGGPAMWPVTHGLTGSR